MKKKLLIFAHRGEAKAFFSQYQLRPNSFLEGLYEGIDHYLLITGEGPWKAGPKLALVLGRFGESIDLVVNLGVAGALRNEVEVGTVYPIRNVYLEQNNEMQFLSHPLDREGIDLITCHTRVLEPKLAEYLDAFAPSVDRELWSLAQACSLSGHTIKSYKLISDQVGDEEICQRVKEQSLEFSNKLFSYYIGLCLDSDEEVLQEEWEGFYFTTSLENQRKKLFHSLCIKYGSEEEAILALDLPNILESVQAPKKKSVALIARMRELLNPIQKELEKSLEKLSFEITHTGAIVKFSQNFERPDFHISALIKNANDLKALQNALSTFDFNKLEALLEGKGLNV